MVKDHNLAKSITDVAWYQFNARSNNLSVVCVFLAIWYDVNSS